MWEKVSWSFLSLPLNKERKQGESIQYGDYSNGKRRLNWRSQFPMRGSTPSTPNLTFMSLVSSSCSSPSWHWVGSLLVHFLLSVKVPQLFFLFVSTKPRFYKYMTKRTSKNLHIHFTLSSCRTSQLQWRFFTWSYGQFGYMGVSWLVFPYILLRSYLPLLIKSRSPNFITMVLVIWVVLKLWFFRLRVLLLVLLGIGSLLLFDHGLVYHQISVLYCSANTHLLFLSPAASVRGFLSNPISISRKCLNLTLKVFLLDF